MKKIFSVALFCIAVNIAKSAPRKAGERPNVIIILSDDQGYGDFSCHGNPILKTPALDRLYNESVRFANFHVSPLCTPTRGELMTGLDAVHNRASTVLAGRGLMRRDIITMPEVFRQNGYRTGIFGKWHLGDSYPDRPMDRGFQKCKWIKGWGILSEAEYDNDYYKTRYLDSLTATCSQKYCTDLWFDEAINWMDDMNGKKQPFFTYLALNAPHGPFYAPEEDYLLYKGKVKDQSTASFFGMISSIDRNMEKLNRWLEAKNIKDNTIIIFMNDNGGTGGIDIYNAGMRGKKGSDYDGGHRAACFIRWPEGGFGKPRTISSASEIQDLLPTFIDLFHFKAGKKYSFDGQSLAAVLRSQNKETKDRMFVVQYTAHSQPDKYSGSVVWNSWRLVGRDELYDISKDPGQEHNLAAAQPGILNKMRVFYENWWKRTASDVNKLVPVVIGSEKENPVILTSNSWIEGDVNTQWKVAQAAGPEKGGRIYVNIEKQGKYRLELSRWPFHLNRDLTINGPGAAVGGTKIRSGKAVPLEFGCVSLNGKSPVVTKKSPRAASIIIEMDLPAGDHFLQAWFRDNRGQDLCGSYYIRAERITL